ncbi:unnamed protein product [Danaus chrysippus]|nr:unnamed protein product [Danaus chrysippus]
MGYYDLPALIDRILNETGSSSLIAIGHSQGTTIFYVLGSTRPEYNSKVNVMISLAPVCYLHNTTSPLLKLLINTLPLVNDILNNLNIHLDEFFGYNSNETAFLRSWCHHPSIADLCMTAGFFQVLGYDPKEFELEFFNVFIHHLPSGTSMKDFLHYIQVENSRQFQWYNYGSDKNMIVYNSTIPPVYDLSKVTMPVALIAAKNDPLSTLANVDLLRRRLANVVYYFVNPRRRFNHGDHIWARNMKVNSIPNVMRVLSKYNSPDNVKQSSTTDNKEKI